MMRHSSFSSITLLVVFALSPVSLVAAERLRVSVNLLDDPLDRSSHAVLLVASEQCGIEIDPVELPTRRALQSLLDGTLDGNLQRITEVAKKYPHLVQVRTPINRVATRIYSRPTATKIQTWSDLKALRVCYQRGVLAIERRLENHPGRKEANDIRDAMRMLDTDVCDVALLHEPIAAPAYATDNVERQSGVLETIDLHVTLQGRHKEHAECLDRQLNRMEKSGEANRLRAAVFKP